jgi:hypothetical protein
MIDMKNIRKFIISIIMFVTGIAAGHEAAPIATANHPFDYVEINYPSVGPSPGCSFQFSPMDFCDARHVKIIKSAISSKSANFNKHYILLSIEEWPPSPDGRSLVAIDTLTGIVYPVPIDAYGGRMDDQGKIRSRPKLFFSLKSNRLCIKGDILVYRANINGHFCFDFDGEKFTGYQTDYMH